MSQDLTPEKIAEIREIFDHFDDNGNQRMEAGEFSRLLEALGGGFAADEADAGLKALDADNNGTIEFDEFLAWWRER